MQHLFYSDNVVTGYNKQNFVNMVQLLALFCY